MPGNGREWLSLHLAIAERWPHLGPVTCMKLADFNSAHSTHRLIGFQVLWFTGILKAVATPMRIAKQKPFWTLLGLDFVPSQGLGSSQVIGISPLISSILPRA